MAGPVRQVAVIPIHEGGVYVVTSRGGKRWVLPKGLIDPGHTPGVTALTEAWEEAGLVGVLDPQPIGSYVYGKLGREYYVLVFRMNVTEARESWPERNSRQRACLPPEDVISRIEEPSLREILRAVFPVHQPDYQPTA